MAVFLNKTFCPFFFFLHLSSLNLSTNTNDPFWRYILVHLSKHTHVAQVFGYNKDTTLPPEEWLLLSKGKCTTIISIEV